jgi:hypothetical protein
VLPSDASSFRSAAYLFGLWSAQIVTGYVARRANELGQGVSRSDLRISANGKNDLLRQIEWLRQSAQSVIRFFFERMSTRSLGRFDILRFGGAGVFESIESGIAINAAERTDSDCAEKILLYDATPM